MSYFKSDTITFEAAMRDLGSGSEKAQVQAAVALADAETSRERLAAAEMLAVAVVEGADEVRIAAARSLGLLGQSVGLPALIDAVSDESPPLRQVALIALGRLGLRDAFDAVATALAEGPVDARFQAARSIVEIDPDRAYEPLLAAIEAEDDPEAVGAIALAIGELGNADAADALADHLESSRDETSFEVAYSLALLGDDRGVETLARFVDTPGLAWDAIEGLERAGGNIAISALEAALSNRKLRHELQLRAAAGALALAGADRETRAAREALLGGLTAWRHHIRALATAELGRIGGPWALSALRRLQARRRGADLLSEIADAIAAIEEREADAPH